ncbi:MAG: protein kinase [Nanoarchaeota archaeon]|nr:protein kinase [Nanoarchaeota archaeon]
MPEGETLLPREGEPERETPAGEAPEEESSPEESQDPAPTEEDQPLPEGEPSEESPPTVETPQEEPTLITIDKYVLGKKIGEGAVGAVYKASDTTKPGETFAFKISNDTIDNNVGQFQREVAILLGSKQEFQHPHLVQVLDAGIHEKKPWLVREYIDGQDLDSLLEEKSQAGEFISTAYGLDILIQIADALKYCHDHTIIHRDLKPGNVLITPGDQVKITDFGLSTVKSSSLTHTLVASLSQTNPEAVGTFEYMSPNQRKGGKPVSQDDLFAFGTLLYKMFTNQLPMESLFKDDPSDINSKIPEEINQVFRKCISQKESEQLQNTEQLYKELIRIRNDLPNLGRDQSSLTILNEGTYQALQERCLGEKGLHEIFLTLHSELSQLAILKREFKVYRPDNSKPPYDFSLKSRKGNECWATLILQAENKYFQIKLHRFTYGSTDYELQFSFTKEPEYDIQHHKSPRKLFGKNVILGIPLGNSVRTTMKEIGEKDVVKYKWFQSDPGILAEGEPQEFFKKVINLSYQQQDETLTALNYFHQMTQLIRGYFADLNKRSRELLK